MLTKLMKDLIGAGMMGIGVCTVILAAVAAAFMAVEEFTGSELTFSSKEDESKK